ncbi:MAG: 50S ribosomal protein L21 [Rhodospirillaceae bacterium]|jgi:large subunit ribosomal protein L21|nr:50S ribosomal protein L21 [Rhodospirillaceae bacterium]
MFAVIKTGGKQYKVEPNDVIRVEKLPGQVGDIITFDNVIMTTNKIGEPTVIGASVTATLLEQISDNKVIVFKKKRRQNYRRKKGHRQKLTVLRVASIIDS